MTKYHNFKLKTERLLLVPARADMALDYLDYLLRNYNWFSSALPDLPETYYTLNGLKRVLEQEEEAGKQGKRIRLMILNPITHSIYGDISIWTDFGTVLTATLGYKLDERHKRKGFMKEALTPCIAHVFNDLMLHRIEASVLTNNTASIKLLQSLGFIYEGMSCSSFKRDGVWRDQYRFSLINRENDGKA